MKLDSELLHFSYRDQGHRRVLGYEIINLTGRISRLNGKWDKCPKSGFEKI